VQSYESGVRGLSEVTFESCLSLAKKCVPPYSRSLPLYMELKRGTEILQTEDQVNAYLSYYGEWHWKKICNVLPHVPMEIFGKPFDLIDWGSGLGIGLLALGDHIGEYSQNLKTVTLIEPSKIALERAVLHARCLFPSATICVVNKRFEDLTPVDFTRQLPVPRIHIFSNVLDMELFRNFEDEALRSFILTVREYAFALDEYFLCVSPCYNGVSARFEKFLEIIKDEERWTLKQLFHCSIPNSRPTLAADIAHYRSKILNGDMHYASESKASTLCDLAAADDVIGLRELVEKGSDVNESDECGLPPLSHAAKAGALEAVRFLAAQEADVNAVNPQGATALYFATKSGDIKIMSYLLACGADMEMGISETGTTPLMLAIERKHLSAIRLLLGLGCRVDYKNVRGLSPMKLAELHATDGIKDLVRQKAQL